MLKYLFSISNSTEDNKYNIEAKNQPHDIGYQKENKSSRDLKQEIQGNNL